MTRLLYVETSPRKDRSASIEVSRAFLQAHRAAHPDDQIETLDIWAIELPSFNGEALAAKYAGLRGVPLTSAQQAVWDDIRRLAAPFLAADKLLLGVPLWNFGIPYRLKQLIDVISQKDILFSFDGSERCLERLVLQRSGKRLAPMACCLDLEKSPRRPVG